MENYFKYVSYERFNDRLIRLVSWMRIRLYAVNIFSVNVSAYI